jgi:hypothetical protein
MHVDWGLAVKLALPGKVTRLEFMTDFSQTLQFNHVLSDLEFDSPHIKSNAIENATHNTFAKLM